MPSTATHWRHSSGGGQKEEQQLVSATRLPGPSQAGVTHGTGPRTARSSRPAATGRAASAGSAAVGRTAGRSSARCRARRAGGNWMAFVRQQSSLQPETAVDGGDESMHLYCDTLVLSHSTPSPSSTQTGQTPILSPPMPLIHRGAYRSAGPCGRRSASRAPAERAPVGATACGSWRASARVGERVRDRRTTVRGRHAGSAVRAARVEAAGE